MICLHSSKLCSASDCKVRFSCLWPAGRTIHYICANPLMTAMMPIIKQIIPQFQIFLIFINKNIPVIKIINTTFVKTAESGIIRNASLFNQAFFLRTYFLGYSMFSLKECHSKHLFQRTSWHAKKLLHTHLENLY